jgi:hypothetical protein
MKRVQSQPPPPPPPQWKILGAGLKCTIVNNNNNNNNNKTNKVPVFLVVAVPLTHSLQATITENNANIRT